MTMKVFQGSRFTVRAVSPSRMIRLFYSRHAVRTTAAASSAAQAAAAPASDLVSWVEGAGGSVAGVSIQRAADTGFGLVAARDCSAGSTLISLPRTCHLTYGEGDGTDPRLLALIDQVPAELWGAKLALQVVAHRLQGEASHFAPYISNLPLGVPGLPMFFDGQSLAALQYPPVTEQVKKRCRWLLSFTQQALAPIRGGEQDPFDGAEVDANALGWALAVVTSRAFRTRGPGQPAAMLPLVDMANHSFQPNARITPGPGGSMCMVATRELQAGEPVLISYGQLSNDFLLMDYGFVIPGNPCDTVQLRFDPGLVEAAKAVAGVGSTGGPVDDGSSSELPPLPAWQQQALAGLLLMGPGSNTEVTIRRQAAPAPAAGAAVSSDGDGSSNSSKAAPTDSPVDPRLLAGVRVLCAPNPAALGGRSGVEQLGRWDVPLAAIQSEIAALRTLTGLVAIALSQFQGSVEDDAALLAAAAAGGGGEQAQQAQQLSPDQQLAVRFRMDKKRLLLEALNTLSLRIKQLASSASGSSSSSGGSKQAAAGGGKGFGGGGGGAKGKVAAAKNGGRGFGS